MVITVTLPSPYPPGIDDLLPSSPRTGQAQEGDGGGKAAPTEHRLYYQHQDQRNPQNDGCALGNKRHFHGA